MKKYNVIILAFIMLFHVCSYAAAAQQESSDNDITFLSRTDNIPEESIKGVPDPYFEGYLQALVDMHFYEYKVVVLAKDHEVWLANLPKNKMIAKSIISFIKDVPGVKEVHIIDGVPPKEMEKREKYVSRPKVKGIWFPQSTELFLPIIANPRQVIYAIGYRGGDRVMGKKAVNVSLGDSFPIFRWIDVLPWHGDMQIGIEAGIWSVFNLDPHPKIDPGTELVNTDFYVGIPISYAVNKWAFRFRIYHISSHLGDEYMVNHPNVVRLNPSYEAIDFFSSWQATDYLRLYIGPGVILHSDDSYPMKHLYVEYGAEARFLGLKMYYHRLYGTFFAGVHLQNWQVLKWDIDGTYVLGYEWSKMQGVGRKIRVYAEYHHGFSLEGQFFKKRTQYGALNFAYGF